MVEGSETPNGEQGSGPEGRPRRSEGDLLAERRARRAAESGEVALMRRAEAAEATVQTLERHVASLQQRLREAEEDRVRISESLEHERTATLERESELRRVKQREYAEQQLRVEAEERMLGLDRESRIEIERLELRLSASEDDARELLLSIERLQRQLAEAEQAAGADRAAVRSVEQGLQERLDDFEDRLQELQRGLNAERTARARSERLLERMREGHARLELLLEEMNTDLSRAVTTALARDERPAIVWVSFRSRGLAEVPQHAEDGRQRFCGGGRAPARAMPRPRRSQRRRSRPSRRRRPRRPPAPSMSRACGLRRTSTACRGSRARSCDANCDGNGVSSELLRLPDA